MTRTYSGVRGAPVGLTAHRPSTRLATGLFCFFVILLSNISNLFNRSAAVSWCVGEGRAGRLFCKPLVGATARGGLQMCLTAKGWAGRLERMLFVFVFCDGVL